MEVARPNRLRPVRLLLRTASPTRPWLACRLRAQPEGRLLHKGCVRRRPSACIGGWPQAACLPAPHGWPRDIPQRPGGVFLGAGGLFRQPLPKRKRRAQPPSRPFCTRSTQFAEMSGHPPLLRPFSATDRSICNRSTRGSLRIETSGQTAGFAANPESQTLSAPPALTTRCWWEAGNSHC